MSSMDDDIAIRVDNVSKDFLLPHDKVGSIKNIFTHILTYITKQRTYERQHALRGISLEIKKGEFFGIVGRNGSGKSTLLKMLAGIYQPTKGKIQVNGKLVPFIELGVGFNPELTGRQNVYLNGALLGFTEEETDAQYKAIVEFAELEEFMDQKLKNYSSGMQVRLAFSAAIRAKADILLIDEVLAVGDADFQRKCFNYFQKLKKEHVTVVFVSHNMDAIREFCDRAALIEDSYLKDTGSTDRIAEKYLKLFVHDQTTAQPLNENDKDRWGNRDIVTESLLVKSDPKEVSIEQKLKVNKSIKNPIIGFRIRNSQGRDILGTNTKIEHRKLGALEAGDRLTVAWSFPNIFSDGTYIVDPAILLEDGITVLDWWNEASRFTIKKDRHLPYSIDPAFKLEVA